MAQMIKVFFYFFVERFFFVINFFLQNFYSELLLETDKNELKLIDIFAGYCIGDSSSNIEHKSVSKYFIIANV